MPPEGKEDEGIRSEHNSDPPPTAHGASPHPPHCELKFATTFQMIAYRLLFCRKWISGYTLRTLRADAIAGITVGVMVIPQGLAYGSVAGFNPVMGLYASCFPLIGYALLGSSGQLAIGPTAIHAMIVAECAVEVASQVGGGMTPLQAALLLSLTSGVLRVVMGFSGMGFLANFLSASLISGFTSAAGVTICFSQVAGLLGLSVVRGSDFYMNCYKLFVAFGKFSVTSVYTSVMGICVVLYLVLIRRVRQIPVWFPHQLLAMAVCLGVVYFTGLPVSVVGQVPLGLPPLSTVSLTFDTLVKSTQSMLVVTFVAFMESIALGKKFARERHYNIDASQELLALGVANVAGAFTSAFPVTGSFSRTVVNATAGAETPFANLFCAAVVVLVLGLLTGLFYYLPKTCLAAIVIASSWRLVEYDEFLRLWRSKLDDRFVWLCAFLSTLALGISRGMMVAILISFAMMIKRQVRPRHAVLGRILDDNCNEDYRDVSRFPDAYEIPGVLIWRFDSHLAFVNAEYFQDCVDSLASRRKDVQFFVLDCRGINEVDSTGLDALENVCKELQAQNIAFRLANVKGPLRDLFTRLYPAGELPFHADLPTTVEDCAQKLQSAGMLEACVTSATLLPGVMGSMVSLPTPLAGGTPQPRTVPAIHRAQTCIPVSNSAMAFAAQAGSRAIASASPAPKRTPTPQPKSGPAAAAAAAAPRAPVVESTELEEYANDAVRMLPLHQSTFSAEPETPLQ